MTLDRTRRPGAVRFLLAALTALFPVAASPAAAAAGTDHVVLVVFDGMRPDFITPQYAPNLYSLATNGVFFRRHHPVYVSTTIVNGTALATGMNPGKNGVIANSDFHLELNSQSAVATEALDTIRRGDLWSGGKYIPVDTVAELIQDAGHHTFIAGTKGVTLVHDRRQRLQDTPAHRDSVTLFRGVTLPRSALEPLTRVNDKVFPDTFTTPNNGSDGWTTKALTHGLWRKGVPKYSVLWLSDPDVTQHAKGVGSPEALSAIESSDKNLGEVIKMLKEKGEYEKTDLMVVSDHGFSTIARSADVTDALKRRGVHAVGKLDNAESGDVLVVGLGGSALIYVVDRREDVLRKAVEALQTCDFTGVIFSRTPIEGTFPLDSIKYPVSTNAPDLVVSMRWMPDRNEVGAPGLIVATGGSKNGGTHGSLSRFDMNNTLVASGPDFKRGFMNNTPSGNIDLAPTILHLLGIKPREPMDGRVLREALVNGTAPEVKERKLEAARQLGFMKWSQYLQVSEVDGATYFDEGNGDLVLQK